MTSDAENVVTDAIVRMRKYLPGFKPKTVRIGNEIITLFEGEGESIKVVYCSTKKRGEGGNH